MWRLPLVDDYEEALAAPVADAAHVPATARSAAGAITAALFLRGSPGAGRGRTSTSPGPARSEAEQDEVPRGATGFGTRLLLRWLEPGRPADVTGAGSVVLSRPQRLAVSAGPREQTVPDGQQRRTSRRRRGPAR